MNVQLEQRVGQHPLAISARVLVKQYPDRAAVAGIDLDIRRGEVFGLLGPNGAGKTTTVEMIAGLRTPTTGSVRVLGLDPARQRKQLTSVLSVQPQAAQLFPTLTVSETLELFASFYANPRTPAEVIEQVGLQGSRRVRVAQLSGGQTRRLLIGIAVIGRPRVMILDEPSAGLDPSARRELWALVTSLRGDGTTVLLTTHHMDEAMELCDRVAMLVSGRVVALGSPEELVTAYFATSRVRFVVSADTDPALIANATGDHRTSVTFRGSDAMVEVETPDPDALLRRVTFTPGLGARGFRVDRGSLEDVFRTLAGDARGDQTSELSEPPDPSEPR